MPGMIFAPPLRRARLLRRYKRFFVDVDFGDGAAVTAHCPNPGAMLGLAAGGTPAWLAPAAGGGRTLPFRLELCEDATTGAKVGVNTGRANAIVAEAIAARRIAELADYERMRREVTLPEGGRLDFLLESEGRPPCYVEVKSVTLKRDTANPGLAEFPDARTSRGARHMAALAGLVARGANAAVLFLVQRADCRRFAVAEDIDPDYAAALAAARAAGVGVLAYGCAVSTEAVALADPGESHLR
jgi:sugar fermentation stimulation protein A